MIVVFLQASSAYDLDPVTIVRSFFGMAKIPEFSCFMVGPKRIQTITILGMPSLKLEAPRECPGCFLVKTGRCVMRQREGVVFQST